MSETTKNENGAILDDGQKKISNTHRIPQKPDYRLDLSISPSLSLSLNDFDHEIDSILIMITN